MKWWLKRRTKNGQHRRASEASESGTANQSDPGTGGTAAQVTCGPITYTYFTGGGTSQGTSLANYYAQAQLAAQAQAQQQAQAQAVLKWYVGYGFNEHSKTPSGKWCPPWAIGELYVPNDYQGRWKPHPEIIAMKSDGVQAGEIIAYRAWHWDGERLRSIFVDYRWAPDAPAWGLTKAGYGIHAFKYRKRAEAEYHAIKDQVILGQVALWGDVIEFEAGYVAEFARVVSLETNNQEIKKLYGIKET